MKFNMSEDVMRLFTCTICNQFCDHATAISECNHTFCKKCIEQKITEENVKACPVCKVDLGVAPLATLSADTHWDDMISRYFQRNPESVKGALHLQYSRKKKSVSSLLASTSKAASLPESNPVAPLEHAEKLDEQVEKSVSLIQSSSKPTSSSLNPVAPLEPEKLDEQVPHQSSSKPVSKFRKRPRKKNLRPGKLETPLKPELLVHKEVENGFKIPLNIKQDNGLAGASASKGCKQNKEIPSLADNLGKSWSIAGKEVMPPKRDNTAMIVFEPAVTTTRKGKEILNGDTEKVYGAKANQKNTVLAISDIEAAQVSKESFSAPVSRSQKKKDKQKVSDGKGKGKAKPYSPPKLRSQKQKEMNSDGAGTSQATEKELEESSRPVWFALHAVKNQNTSRPLPQISSTYYRIKNGNVTAADVKKLIVKKLGLESHDEVDLWLRQEQVCSTQTLQTMVTWWVATTPESGQKSAMVGDSAAEFVMVLNYSRSLLTL